MFDSFGVVASTIAYHQDAMKSFPAFGEHACDATLAHSCPHVACPSVVVQQ
jgi:hypothetical protein